MTVEKKCLAIKLAVQAFRSFIYWAIPSAYRQIIVPYNGWTRLERAIPGLQGGVYSFSHFSLLLNTIWVVTMLTPTLGRG